MSAVMKTPGVYIVDSPSFPNSVIQVATSIPAFIGYTEKADDKGKSLRNLAMRISSMADYSTFFGGPQQVVFQVKRVDPKATPPQDIVRTGTADYQVFPRATREERFLLYSSMRLFFDNGGGPCYIVSVGTYADAPISADALSAGINLLEREMEPTIVVIPDAVHLATAPECIKVQQQAMMHCAKVMQNRVAILDIYDGYLEQNDPAGDPVKNFRDNLGINYLDFAAAYYPWLDTTILTDTEVTHQHVDTDSLTDLLTAEAFLAPDIIDELKAPSPKYAVALLTKALNKSSEVFPLVIAEIERQLNQLPPSAAIAGIYSQVDGSLGVWKAPANVSLNSVNKPTVNISDQEQENLNDNVQGKAINAIRNFVGEGVLVWGARTLDANSPDWRYINVRRTMIMIEQSIKLAVESYVLESNDANTWVTVKSMVNNFLTNLWKQGALAGAAPEEAFSVSCGLGETMTGDEILEGIMCVTALVAVTKPAEFLEITFQQRMQ